MRVHSTVEGKAWLQEVPFLNQECGAGNLSLSHFGKTGSKEGPKMCPGIKSQALPLVMDFLQRSPTAFQRSPASSREAPASSRGAPLPPEEPQSLKVSQPSKTASPASTGTSLGGAFHIQGTASICQKLGQEFLLTFLFLGEQG